MSALGKGLLTSALLVGGFVAFWHFLAQTLALPAYLLPSPASTLREALEHRATLAGSALVTGYEVLLAFTLSTVVGIPVGFAAGKSRFFSRNVLPLIVASQSVPKLALAPLFTVWLGFGLAPKVLIAFLIAVFPVVINTTVGIRSARPESILLARSLGLTPWQTFRKIELPAALPHIFAGLRTAAAFAVSGAVVGEYVGADAGLGRLTQVAASRLDTPLLFAALTVLGVLGVAAYAAVGLVERIALPWRRESAIRYLGGM